MSGRLGLLWAWPGGNFIEMLTKVHIAVAVAVAVANVVDAQICLSSVNRLTGSRTDRQADKQTNRRTDRQTMAVCKQQAMSTALLALPTQQGNQMQLKKQRKKFILASLRLRLDRQAETYT